MRVKVVQIREHPGFGDLEVDFSDISERAARLVVIAGENGSGKTALLEAIFTALAPTGIIATTPRRIAPGKYRVLVETDSPIEFLGNMCSRSDNETLLCFDRWPDFEGVIVEFDGSVVRNGMPHLTYHRSSDRMSSVGLYDSVQIFGGGFGCFYSEATVSFDVPAVTVIGTSAGERKTSSQDVRQNFQVRSGSTLAVEIAQLLVDLQAADDREASEWLRTNEGRPPDSIIEARVRRFKDAFARIAQDKEYVGFETVDGEHRVLFQQNGRKTALNDLSTGEKQIVFRGAFLLRNADKLRETVALIDEPELSLHPKWQEHILDFFNKIVEEEQGRRNQIIIATHSPFIVHGSPTAKHVVLKRECSPARVYADPKPSFAGASAAEVAVAAFDLHSFVASARGHSLLVLVEGPTDQQLINIAWQKLRPGRAIPFTISPANGAKNMPRLLGAGGGGSSPLIDELSSTGTSLLGLFDFDQEGVAQWNGTIDARDCQDVDILLPIFGLRKRRGQPVWVALLPVPTFRSNYASAELGPESRLTIELLFDDQTVGHLLTRVPVAGESSAFRLKATASQKAAVAELAKSLTAADFRAFEPLLLLIENVAAFQRGELG